VLYSSDSLWSFGQEGQILVRCSAGNLVKSSTECPSTDICPPPEPNIVVHCIKRQEPKSFSFPQTNGKERQALNILTNKPAYKLGEVINITVKNVGADPLTFPNSILGLKIENAATHEKYPLFAAQVITTLDSGGSKSLKWNQKDSFGNQVNPGNYTAFTSTGPLSANTTFSLIK
jgi:hypothetical protein